jgi:hypothetical protein
MARPKTVIGSAAWVRDETASEKLIKRSRAATA